MQEREAGPAHKELKQRPWGNSAYKLAQLTLLYNPGPPTCLEVALPTVTQDIP